MNNKEDDDDEEEEEENAINANTLSLFGSSVTSPADRLSKPELDLNLLGTVYNIESHIYIRIHTSMSSLQYSNYKPTGL